MELSSNNDDTDARSGQIRPKLHKFRNTKKSLSKVDMVEIPQGRNICTTSSGHIFLLEGNKVIGAGRPPKFLSS